MSKRSFADTVESSDRADDYRVRRDRHHDLRRDRHRDLSSERRYYEQRSDRYDDMRRGHYEDVRSDHHHDLRHRSRNDHYENHITSVEQVYQGHASPEVTGTEEQSGEWSTPELYPYPVLSAELQQQLAAFSPPDLASGSSTINTSPNPFFENSSLQVSSLTPPAESQQTDNQTLNQSNAELLAALLNEPPPDFGAEIESLFDSFNETFNDSEHEDEHEYDSDQTAVEEASEEESEEESELEDRLNLTSDPNHGQEQMIQQIIQHASQEEFTNFLNTLSDYDPSTWTPQVPPPPSVSQTNVQLQPEFLPPTYIQPQAGVQAQTNQTNVLSAITHSPLFIVENSIYDMQKEQMEELERQESELEQNTASSELTRIREELYALQVAHLDFLKQKEAQYMVYLNTPIADGSEHDGIAKAMLTKSRLEMYNLRTAMLKHLNRLREELQG
ncbi:hypothetical protein BT63DRAFT_299489 [Microthyrium microscopicum]|uniref:Uncharacterized protein n=1 Tax=Microthyrium microscopicum TaxID=703497 RepID=A0A6A6U8V6_9PEZI|nr:hypothetical protein BT63DRAFT_299489 [Microthyrium microscopicum]